MSTETENVEDLLDAEELAESLTGFDQIAIRQRWNQRFDELSEDGLMLLRVLLFIHLRRQDGGGREVDKCAYTTAMDCPLTELQARFKDQDESADLDEDESVVAERDREFAEFVVATGLSYTVEQYMQLTLSQRGQVLSVASKRR